MPEQVILDAENLGRPASNSAAASAAFTAPQTTADSTLSSELYHIYLSLT